MKGFTQINVKKAILLYRRPASQKERVIPRLLIQVQDTNLMLLLFLDLKKWGPFTDNILSHETDDPYLKTFTF